MADVTSTVVGGGAAAPKTEQGLGKVDYDKIPTANDLKKMSAEDIAKLNVDVRSMSFNGVKELAGKLNVTLSPNRLESMNNQYSGAATKGIGTVQAQTSQHIKIILETARQDLSRGNEYKNTAKRDCAPMTPDGDSQARAKIYAGLTDSGKQKPNFNGVSVASFSDNNMPSMSGMEVTVKGYMPTEFRGEKADFNKMNFIANVAVHNQFPGFDKDGKPVTFEKIDNLAKFNKVIEPVVIIAYERGEDGKPKLDDSGHKIPEKMPDGSVKHVAMFEINRDAEGKNIKLENGDWDYKRDGNGQKIAKTTEASYPEVKWAKTPTGVTKDGAEVPVVRDRDSGNYVHAEVNADGVKVPSNSGIEIDHVKFEIHSPKWNIDQETGVAVKTPGIPETRTVKDMHNNTIYGRTEDGKIEPLRETVTIDHNVPVGKAGQIDIDKVNRVVNTMLNYNDRLTVAIAGADLYKEGKNIENETGKNPFLSNPVATVEVAQRAQRAMEKGPEKSMGPDM